MRGRQKALLILSESEREQLEALAKRRKTAQALALRARIVLACAEGADNLIVAARQRYGLEVALAVRRAPSGWFARCSAPEHAQDDR